MSKDSGVNVGPGGGGAELYAICLSLHFLA